MSKILCLPSLPVKPTRRSPRPARPFAEGLYPRRPRRFEPSPADLRYAAETSPFAGSLYDVIRPEPDYDTLAAIAEAEDRIERGTIL